MGKKQITLWVDTELLKQFQKKLIDLDKTRTAIFTEWIKDFLKKK